MWDQIRYVGPRQVSGTEGDRMMCWTTKEKLAWTPENTGHKKTPTRLSRCFGLAFLVQ